ncbi:MAG: ABC transporter permease subunit [Anaerolineae bacterium]
MSVKQEGPPKAVISSRLTFSEQMRHFPWWAIIMITGLIVAFMYMMTSQTYRDALNFIVRPPTATEMAFGIEVRNGLMMTLVTTVFAYLIALIFGLFLGVMRVSKNPILFHASTLYVELMRGVPMLVLIIWIGFVVVPFLRLRFGEAFPITGVQGAILGLGFGYAAYLAEVYRSGIEFDFARPDGGRPLAGHELWPVHALRDPAPGHSSRGAAPGQRPGGAAQGLGAGQRGGCAGDLADGALVRLAHLPRFRGL